MFTKHRGKALFTDVDFHGDLGGSTLQSSAAASSPLTGAVASSMVLLPRVEQIVLTTADKTMTDTGGANGGYLALPAFVFPSTRIVILGGFLRVQIHSVGAGILATATVNMAVGSEAAVGGALAGAKVDIMASSSVNLVAGAGALELITPVLLTYFDATSAKTAYVNFYVADAQITANTIINMTTTLRLAYLDLSRGA